MLLNCNWTVIEKSTVIEKHNLKKEKPVNIPKDAFSEHG